MEKNTMNGLKRTHYCGTLNINNVGQKVVVSGFAAKARNLGNLQFIDLRDRTGILQLAFDDSSDRELFEYAKTVRSEFVLMAEGTVRERESKNMEISTGEIEVYVTDLRILSKAQTPPFEIVENSAVKEELRLKYRYLDLRRADLQNNIIMRHKIVKAARDYFDANGFIEIETPILIKSTPEGARDFLVPSRVHDGKFYALPQSPQLYKQLLMVSGFDRYVQFARCFRDEDLRADRQPEFTQVDMEMSYVDVDDVMAVVEGFMQHLFREVMDTELTMPIRRMTYREAMEKYGSDKPDVRYGYEIVDLTDIVKDCDFTVFNSAAQTGSVRAICVENGAAAYSRKDIDKLTEQVRGIGGKGLAWIKITDEGIQSSFSKFMKEEEMRAIVSKMGAKKGDIVFVVADAKNKIVLSVLGMLRQEAAKRLDAIPQNKWCFLWITEFPFFEWDEDLGTYVAMHHPFTSPMQEDIALLDTDKGNVRAKAYDLVLNGIELCSGSIRITDPVLQKKMFTALGLSDEEAYQKFGFLTDAFTYGAPPHGGMGLGLDRLVMLMLGAESLRDIIAFPKVQNMMELMTECPSPVDEAQLSELHIGLAKKEKE
ncbi:MAG: aspartate--tRNA ligase [Oscillospiraceae bacterium]|nr:aspartate--tRNA ligase [Oscillospiraceae bacterium]